MKSITAIIAVTVFFAVVCGYFYLRPHPVEEVVNEVLASRSKNEVKTELTPELKEFVSWYQPMVSDATEEVAAVMKRFDAKYRADGYRNRDLEEVVPADEWIKRLLDMGIKIEDYEDYEDYLEDRYYAYYAATDPEELQERKGRHGLEPDASFDEVVEADIRENVLFKQLLDQAMENDPKVYGGEFGADGVFIPFRFKTVYVQHGTITSGTGVPKWVVYEIRDRDMGLPPSRELPKDIDIIYLDEKGQPIKDRVPPRGGDGNEIERFSSRESDPVFEPTSEQSLGGDDFGNSFPDDLPPSDADVYEFEKPNVPQSVADLEKQLTPEGIEAELSQGVSADRFDKAQQLIDEYGTAEGLRRLREMDPEAARQFERERRGAPSREVPSGDTHLTSVR